MSVVRSSTRLLAVALAAHIVGAPVAAPAAPAPPPTVEVAGIGKSGEVRVMLAEPGQSLRLPLQVSGTLPEGAVFQWVTVSGEPGPSFPAAADLAAQAPALSGTWRLHLRTGAEARAFDTFHLLVKVPAAQASRGRLRGYHVGEYPSGTGRYAPPAGFVEVTESNRDLQISRSLRLSSFLTHDQANVWPKYVLVDERLLDKLELMIDELRTLRPTAARLTIMSGFRTPQYNAQGLSAGRATLSRHQYGDAADVWIDDDGDGRMDDLDRNGRTDVADAGFLARIIERVEARHPELAGGVSAYPATPAHGPFVHVDARGVRARW
jgi:uncharacterized protein YcbK (DUF882 family)